MKKSIVFAAIAYSFFLYACGGAADKTSANESPKEETSSSSGSANATDNPSYDPERGTGKFTTVDIPVKLDAAMAANGEKVFDVKCSSCHKITDEKLVGPGWKGVTKRHKPEWILNFITNPDEMIDKDPKAQAMLEICMVRMPNQNLTDVDARALYEFMRKNDDVK
ncbi:MAG: cytochrome c [Chitinophagaceae bacterium]|nr:cytochrome c [Chitinophagaceae bacterium]